MTNNDQIELQIWSRLTQSEFNELCLQERLSGVEYLEYRWFQIRNRLSYDEYSEFQQFQNQTQIVYDEYLEYQRFLTNLSHR